MGILGRRRGGGAPRVHDCHSVAAFAPGDVEDAERTFPATTLADYAAARQLRYAEQQLLDAVIGVQPRWRHYVRGAATGALSDERFGAVGHELLELSIRRNQQGGKDLRMGGDWHGVRLRNEPGGLLKLVPGVELLGIGDRSDEPFGDEGAWAPTTSVTLLVPEAALLGELQVRSADRMDSSDNPRLADHGLPGYRVLAGGEGYTGAGGLAAVVAGPIGAVLRRLEGPYVELHLKLGQLRLRRNGFVPDPHTLDALVDAALEIADAFAALARPVAGAPFDWVAPLGPPPPPAGGRLADLDRWDATLDAAAAAKGLVREDPAALHRGLPRLPVPGRSRGVLRGAVPGAADARLTFHQHSAGSVGLRPALLLPAPAGAAVSPPGGVLHESSDMVVGVADGVVAAWKPALDRGELSITGTAERGLAALRALGLA